MGQTPEPCESADGKLETFLDFLAPVGWYFDASVCGRRYEPDEETQPYPPGNDDYDPMPMPPTDGDMPDDYDPMPMPPTDGDMPGDDDPMPMPPTDGDMPEGDDMLELLRLHNMARCTTVIPFCIIPGNYR